MKDVNLEIDCDDGEYMDPDMIAWEGYNKKIWINPIHIETERAAS